MSVKEPDLRSMDTFVAGDPLRGWGVVAVMLTHIQGPIVGTIRPLETSSAIADTFGPAAALFSFGSLALMIFFSLSGYLIGRPFIRAYIAGRPPPRLGPYLRNRLLRIVPMFWFTFLLCLLIFQPADASLWDMAAVYLFLQNYNPGPITGLLTQAWSIDVEMAFYALLPAVALILFFLTPSRLGRRLRGMLMLGVLAVGYLGSLYFWFTTPQGSVWEQSMPYWLWTFIPGLVLATIEPFALPRLRGRTLAPKLALVLGALAALLMVAWSSGAHQPQESTEIQAIRLWIFMATILAFPGLALAAPMVRQWGGWPGWRFLDNLPARWLGARSYSIYLLHFIPVALFRDDIPRLADGAWSRLGLLALIEFGLVLPAAALTYRFVERPFLGLKRRRRTGSLAPVAGKPAIQARGGEPAIADPPTPAVIR